MMINGGLFGLLEGKSVTFQAIEEAKPASQGVEEGEASVGALHADRACGRRAAGFGI